MLKKTTNLEAIIIVGTVLFVLAFIAAAPIALIWALNTLFGFSIAFTAKNWLAAFVLIALCSIRPGSKG